MFEVFRVKNHDFTPKNHIFSNCGGRRKICWGISWKNHDYRPKNHIFSNFRGTPPQILDPPLLYSLSYAPDNKMGNNWYDKYVIHNLNQSKTVLSIMCRFSGT
jgi:hypothetical protein